MVRRGMPSPLKALLDAATRRADKLRVQGKEIRSGPNGKHRQKGLSPKLPACGSRHYGRRLTTMRSQRVIMRRSRIAACRTGLS
jgi:hypothetical protein